MLLAAARMRSLSAILKEPGSYVALRGKVEAVLAAWPARVGLRFVDEGLLTDEPQLKIDVWTEEADPMIEINLVRDEMAAMTYLQVVSDDKTTRQRLWQQVNRDFTVSSLEELQRAVREQGASDPAAYLRLALASGEVLDATSAALVREGLASPLAAVRAHAAMAAGMCPSPPLADAAAAALAVESDDGVARLLAAAVQLARETHP